MKRRKIMQDRLHDFTIWLDHHQVDCSGFEFSSQELDFATFSKSGCPVKSNLVAIPLSIAFTLFVARETQSALAAISTGAQVSAKTIMLIAMLEQLNDPTGFWHPYFAAMPLQFHDPLWWSTEDLAEIEGTNAWYSIRTMCTQLHAEYDAVLPAVIAANPRLFPAEAFSFEKFLWAHSAFLSRSFPSRLVTSQHRCIITPNRDQTLSDVEPTPPQQESSDELGACLLPLFDMLNHHHHAPVTWHSDTQQGWVRIRTETALNAGAEMVNCYGPRSNEELLVCYGFCLPENPYDEVVIQVAISPDARSRVESLLSQFDLSLRVTVTAAKGVEDFLAVLRVCMFNQDDDWYFARERIQTREDLYKQWHAGNEVMVLESAAALLAQRLCALPGSAVGDEEALLASDGLSLHRKSALLYRIGLRRILSLAAATVASLHLALIAAAHRTNMNPQQIGTAVPASLLATKADGTAGLLCTNDVAPNTVLCSISVSDCATASDAPAELCAEVDPEDTAALCALAVLQRLDTTGSDASATLWKHLRSAVPRPNVCMWGNAAELFDDDSILEQCEEFVQHASEVFQQLPHGSTVDVNEFTWALAVAEAFAVTVGSKQQQQHQQQQQLFVVPLVERPRHHAVANAKWTLDETGQQLQLHTLCPLEAGAEVFCRYTAHSATNAELLTRFGLIMEHNPVDVMELALPFAAASSARRLIAKRWNLDGPHFIRTKSSCAQLMQAACVLTLSTAAAKTLTAEIETKPVGSVADAMKRLFLTGDDGHANACKAKLVTLCFVFCHLCVALMEISLWAWFCPCVVSAEVCQSAVTRRRRRRSR
eukprot:TRINITY_DN4348_c1_g1_i2.p1 TRINITY_DN4348_c1_g1~~TRINITY_DN4348_c1_g1_i2.p1  ORF type:complete len:823 (-),score=165.16 TRINITY_DN4348_c1_g1_i2:255-2723(-)